MILLVILLVVVPLILSGVVTKNSEEQSLSSQADVLDADQLETEMQAEYRRFLRQFESSVARGKTLSGEFELREELYTYYGRPCILQSPELAGLAEGTLPPWVGLIVEKKLEHLHRVFREEVPEMNAILQTVEGAGIYTMNFNKRKGLYDSTAEACVNRAFSSYLPSVERSTCSVIFADEYDGDGGLCGAVCHWFLLRAVTSPDQSDSQDRIIESVGDLFG